MHGLHARLPRNFVLEERLERYADAIELEPARLAGRWVDACTPIGCAPFREVRLDVGCGKGAFLTASAAAEPDVLFIGLDGEPVCIVYSAQHIIEEGLGNALVIPGLGDDLVASAGALPALSPVMEIFFAGRSMVLSSRALRASLGGMGMNSPCSKK